MIWLDSITDSMDMNLSKLREIVEDRGACCAVGIRLQRVGHNLETKQQPLKYVDIFVAVITVILHNSL